MKNIVFYISILTIIFYASSCGSDQPSDPVEPIIDNRIIPIVSQVDTNTVTTPSNVIANDISNIKTDVPQALKVWDLRAEMTRAEFEQKKGAELEMALIRPIYSKIYDLDEQDSLVIPQLTEGQKALYFFRKMDESMSEGGIESLYQTNVVQYLPTAANSFRHIKIEKLGILADKAAIDHKRLNSLSNPNRNVEIDPFMKGFDDEYAKNHNDFYKKLENYIRTYPEEFIKFKD